jgi:hypothetical protein
VLLLEEGGVPVATLAIVPSSVGKTYAIDRAPLDRFLIDLDAEACSGWAPWGATAEAKLDGWRAGIRGKEMAPEAAFGVAHPRPSC